MGTEDRDPDSKSRLHRRTHISPGSAAVDLTVSSPSEEFVGGKWYSIDASEMMGNLVATKMCLNRLNTERETNRILTQEKTELLAEVALLSIQPLIAGVLAVASISGAVLIGIATNILTGDGAANSWAWAILAVGVGLSLLGISSSSFLNLLRRKLKEVIDAYSKR
ncbi:MAG: hypothetical protein HYV26_22065 [Candidatus Hydrogenedentes bacterium]|nr:hypothetical protein [Candidatus Hydrogenedentota bacterium]